ncbi:MAG: hypothetical protein AB1656_16910 [Candidatus Omnitrophota bacterium]
MLDSEKTKEQLIEELIHLRQELSENKREELERKRIREEREKLILELRGALTQVRTLSGLLPICASCKKIRDEKGYWNQLENYIQDHSDAIITHGICPECAEKMSTEYSRQFA